LECPEVGRIFLPKDIEVITTVGTNLDKFEV
jgi:hypothetical protein